MSNNLSNDTSLPSTKQMLDELDALMERMLALPVNDPDSAPPVPKEPPVAVTAPTAVIDAPPPKPKPATAPSPTAKTKDSKLAQILAELKSKQRLEPSAGHAPTNPPHRTPTETTQPELPGPPLEPYLPAAPASLLPKLEPLLADIPDTRPATSTRWFYGSLLAINRLFDSATGLFGGAGDVLRSAGGRTVLGLCGVALLAASIGWLLKDYLGWHW